MFGARLFCHINYVLLLSVWCVMYRADLLYGGMGFEWMLPYELFSFIARSGVFGRAWNCLYRHILVLAFWSSREITLPLYAVFPRIT